MDRFPRLAKLGHVVLNTPDLEASRVFFSDVIGLEEVTRDERSVELSCWGDYGHHSLSLVAADEASVGHIGWRAWDAEAVEEIAERLQAKGVAVERVPEGSEPGQGDAIRFAGAGLFPFEVYHKVLAAPPAEASRRSVIKTNQYAAQRKGISPRRLDHVNVTCPEPEEAASWLQEELGFRTREYIHRDGRKEAIWMAVSAVAHDLAVGSDPNGRAPGFHHVAFYLDGGSDVLRAAEILAEHGIAADHGPGRHAISQALCLYVRDPGSGHRVELYTGSYLVLDPDWEPIGWSEQEYRQWWGPEITRLTAGEFMTTTRC